MKRFIRTCLRSAGTPTLIATLAMLAPAGLHAQSRDDERTPDPGTEIVGRDWLKGIDSDESLLFTPLLNPPALRGAPDSIVSRSVVADVHTRTDNPYIFDLSRDSLLSFHKAHAPTSGLVGVDLSAVFAAETGSDPFDPPRYLTWEAIGLDHLYETYGDTTRRLISNTAHDNLARLIVEEARKHGDFLLISDLPDLWTVSAAVWSILLEKIKKESDAVGFPVVVRFTVPRLEMRQTTFMDDLDGVFMAEAANPFNRMVDTDTLLIRNELDEYRRLLDSGRLVLLTPGLGGSDEYTFRQTRIVAAAAMMIREKGDAIFVGADWNILAGRDNAWSTWPARFGDPIAPAVREGWIWRREFAGGTMTVDFQQETITETVKTLGVGYEGDASQSMVSVEPNPFSGSTTLRFTLDSPCNVRLTIHDALGAVRTIPVDDRLEAGEHHISLDAGTLPAGTYHYRLTAGAFEKSGVLVHVK